MAENARRPKVLVVDDERVIADTLSVILNRAGFDASAVYSAMEAVERAKTTNPQLVICDVVMKDAEGKDQPMNGVDAAIQIRQSLPATKVLLFSGQAAAADLLDKARQQGHDFEILAKPVHPDDLLAKLRG